MNFITEILLLFFSCWLRNKLNSSTRAPGYLNNGTISPGPGFDDFPNDTN